MHKVDIGAMALQTEKGPGKEVIYNAGALKAQVMRLHAGQIIPPCKMENDVLFYIIQGEGEIIVDQEKEELAPMLSVVVPGEAGSRSISAKTDMLVLAVQEKRAQEIDRGALS
jgi:quercetin dioxygenase-like cupin family protein